MANTDRQPEPALTTATPAEADGSDQGGPDPGGAAPTWWQPPEAVALDQFFDADTLFQLRSAVAAHGGRLGLNGHRLSDLVLVAHELASNAVRHGGATVAEPGRLRLWRADHTVICQVSDGGPGLVDANRAGLSSVPVAATNGRGLWIIRQVVAQLHIHTGPDGSTLTAALPLVPANAVD
ncbi:MAG TPA: ATP-binding protein [Micromonosporaceae bacterium]